MLLQDAFTQNAARRPERIALELRGRGVSYGELDEAAWRMAGALHRLGVRRGDRVLAALPNGLEAALVVLGALRAGAVFSLLHPGIDAERLHAVVANCEPQVLLAPEAALGRWQGGLAALPKPPSIVATGASSGRPGVGDLDSLLASERPQPRSSGCIDLDVAAIIYTSGSTGRPKGVTLSHRNMVCAAASIMSYLENDERDAVFCCLPLSFDYGLYQLLMTLSFGGRLVLEQGFAYPYRIIERIAESGATGLPLVPTMAAILARLPESVSDKLRGLRYVTNTAGALPVEHINALRELLPETRIYSMYGLTECKRVSFLRPEELEARPTSVGRAIPNTEVWIETEDGRRAEPGEEGELIVRGGHVMLGYWNDPEATDAALQPGVLPGERVLRTGDLFRADAEGYLYYIGRRDEMLKVRGMRVFPVEVERALHALPGVAEACVGGVPDVLEGCRLVAFVRPAGSARLDPEGLRAAAARGLPTHLAPCRVHIVEALDRTPTGKVDRRALLRRYYS